MSNTGKLESSGLQLPVQEIMCGISDDDSLWRKKRIGKGMRGPGTSNRIIVQLCRLDRRLFSVMASFEQRLEKSEDD